MGFKKRKAPTLRLKVRETGWWGDEALDREASDMLKWTQTADMEHLVPLPDQELLTVRWRPLHEWELSSLSFSDESAEAFISRCYEATRIGLISVPGEEIKRVRQASVSRITDASMDSLCEYRERIPSAQIVGVVTTASQGIEGEKSDEFFASLPTDLKETSLPLWIGGHILAATFRSFRRNP
jgi:hypothetical protein